MSYSTEEHVNSQTEEKFDNEIYFRELQTPCDEDQFKRLKAGDIRYFTGKTITSNVIEKTVISGNFDDISKLEQILDSNDVKADCELKTFHLVLRKRLTKLFLILLKKHTDTITKPQSYAYALYKIALEANDADSIKFLKEKLSRTDEVDHRTSLSPNRILETDNKIKTEGVYSDICAFPRRKLDEFHVKSSPRYLFTNEKDPVGSVMDLIIKLVGYKKKYRENKDEVELLLKRCKNFMVLLVDLCQNEDEIRQLVNEQNCADDLGEYSRFWKALHGELTEFITHPNVQNWLYKQWLGVSPYDWIKKSSYEKIGFFAENILLSPFCSIYYTFAPRESIIPIKCFIHSIVAYVLFLILLLYTAFEKPNVSSQQDQDHISNAQYIVIIWLISYFFMVVVDFIAVTHASHRHSWWTIYQFIMLSMFLCAGACFLIMKFQVALQLDKYFSIINDGCYSIAITMAFLKILQWFLLSCTLGPIIISFSKMMTVIYQMLIIFAVVLFFFSFGLQNLYRNVQFPPQNGDEKFDDEKTFFNNYVNTQKMLFWTLFGYGRASAVFIPSTNGSLSGDGGRDDDSISTFDRKYIVMQIGYYIWAFFHITFIIVLLNMLIAIMTTSYETIHKSSDVNWKRARTKVWLHYMASHNSIPPPFNILRYLRILVNALLELCNSSNNSRKVRFFCLRKKDSSSNIMDDAENPDCRDTIDMSNTNEAKITLRKKCNGKKDDCLSQDYEDLIRKLASRYRTKIWIDNLPKFTASTKSISDINAML